MVPCSLFQGLGVVVNRVFRSVSVLPKPLLFREYESLSFFLGCDIISTCSIDGVGYISNHFTYIAFSPPDLALSPGVH